MRGEAAALRFRVPGLEPVLAPLRLRPGAPVGLRLLPGHPFSNQARAQSCTHWLLIALCCGTAIRIWTCFLQEGFV